MENERRVVVIGSGPAGAMAAHELVRRGISVTMLESGTVLPGGVLVRLGGRNLYRRVPPLESGAGHVATGDPKTEWYVNLAPGGLSNQWTGAVPRFAPEDFTEGERLHERCRWPVSYDELAPYYESAERLMAVTADVEPAPNLPLGYAAYRQRLPEDWRGIAKFAAAQGQGLTTLPLADGSPWLVTRRGTAFNSYSGIVRKLLGSPLFELRTGVHALKLEWSAAQRKVESVLCQVRESGSRERVTAGAVVLACGALNSAKLLFDSACSDFPEGLGNSRGVLGAYLHDHPREWWVFDTEKPVSLLSPSAYLTRKPYADSAPLLATAWTLGLVTTKDKIRSRLSLKGNSVGVQVFGTMVPSEAHFVKSADDKKDEFGLPALNIRIHYEDDVIANMVEARRTLLCLMKAAGYPAQLREVAPQLFPGSSVHYGGTARMHESPEYGVVDRWNRLYDAPNALVCDAACFTTGAEKNPTLTAMALAARAADRLAQDLKTG